MIGKTLYKAKVINDKIEIFSQKIVKEKGNKYLFDEKLFGVKGCLKDDVGVVCFLTIKEAVDYRIEHLKNLIKMGENYLKNTRLQLSNAKNFQTSKNLKA